MSVARVTEISSTSEKDFEDAIQKGIARAAQTLHGIRGAWIKEQEVQVENNKLLCVESNGSFNVLHLMAHTQTEIADFLSPPDLSILVLKK